MTEPTGTPNSHVVHLVLPVGDDVPLSVLVRTQSAFLELLREVSRAVAATLDDPVEWVVTNVTEGSGDLSLVPIPTIPTVEPQALHLMSEAVPSGIAILREEGAERPPFFTDRALELTTTLSVITRELPKAPRTRNGAAEVEITAQSGIHARHILAQPYIEEFGTIEGRIESVTVRGKRMFAIADDLTGQRIECHFAHRIASDEIGRWIERRVAVSGAVRMRESGEIVSVIAQEMEVLPNDEDLPTADEVLGILVR